MKKIDKKHNKRYVNGTRKAFWRDNERGVRVTDQPVIDPRKAKEEFYAEIDESGLR